MKRNNKVVIFPPCGENVALATKRGLSNKETFFTTLLPRLTAVLPPQGREITAQGFTLIELLIVVLIIGILAAVAVPQYKLAVAKSRAMEGIGLLRTVMQAEEVYYLANGNYSRNITYLDIDIPAEQISNTWGQTDETSPNKYVVSCGGSSESFACTAVAASADLPVFFQSGQFAHEATAGKVTAVESLLICNVNNSKNTTALKVCKSMGKELTANRDYILN